MLNQEKNSTLTLLLIGDHACGKSCLLTKFRGNYFEDLYTPTRETYYSYISIDYNRRKWLLEIWQFSNEEDKYDRMRFHKGCHGLIIVFDLTSRKSFENLDDWVDEIYGKPFIIIGTKSDLKSQRQVLFDEAKEFAENKGSCYIEVSSKTGYNVENAFKLIISEITNWIALAIVGDEACGKSCLSIRLRNKTFKNIYEMTQHPNAKNTQIAYNEKTIKLQIWDTAGIRDIRRKVWNRFHGFMIVFDLTRRSSFNSLTDWINEIRGFQRPFIIIGTKSDLLSQRQVTYEEAKEYADNKNSCYIEVSNANCYNVQNAFKLITREIMSDFFFFIELKIL